MASQWYLIQGDQDFGPLTSDELKGLAAEGRIGPRDLVRKEGTTRWVTASAVQGLLSPPVAKPSVPPAPSIPTGSYDVVEPPPPADVKSTPVEPQPTPVPAAAPEVSGWYRLSGVWVGTGAALVTIAAVVWIVITSRSRDQEGPDLPPFSPPVAKAAPGPARPRPPAKKAVPPAKVAAVKPNPPPTKAEAPKAAPPQSSDPSAEYIQLASALSNVYRAGGGRTWVVGVNPRSGLTEGRLVTAGDGPTAVFGIDAGESNLTHYARLEDLASANGVPACDQITGALSKLKGAGDPVVKEAVARLETGLQQSVEAAKKIDEEVERASQAISHAGGRSSAPRQADGESNGSYQDRVAAAQRSDAEANAAAVEGAKAYYEQRKREAPKDKRNALILCMEAARLDCWKKLAPRLSETYRPSPQINELVQFRITAPDAAAKKPKGEFTVANQSGRTLTNVTLVLDLLHFATAPEPTVLQVYFIPEWQDGHTLRLPMHVAQNRAPGELSKDRPMNADPLRDSSTGNSRPERDAWLVSLGGLVAVQASLWSAQAHQPVQIFPFPDQALAGARQELEVAAQLARNRSNTLMRSASPKTKFTLPADHWEVRAAKRVLTYVPPDSDLARQAHLIIDDPLQLLREHSLGADTLIARLAPGTVFQGKWTFRMPHGPPMRYGELTRERMKKLARLKDHSFPCTLTINACNSKTGAVGATLIAATPPGTRREFKGQIVEDRGTGHVRLVFPAGRAAAQRSQLLMDTDFDLFTAPETLTIELNGERLLGKMPGPLAWDVFWFDVEFTSGGNTR
jgi:hypothetical protein